MKKPKAMISCFSGPARVWVAAGLALGLSGASLTLSGCGDSGSEANTKAAGTTADVVPVRRQSFMITVSAMGELEPKNAIEIRSQIESRTSIVELVAEGTRVTKGDLLLRLNADALQSQLEDQSLRVESARSELVAAENAFQIQVSDNTSRLNKAKVDVELAELALLQWRDGDVKSKRQALTLAIDRGQREVKRLREREERSVELFAKNYLSKDELELDRLAKVQAEADLEKALLDQKVYEDYTYQMEEKEKLSAVEQAKAELSRVELNNEKELASKRAEANNKREQLRILEAKLQKVRDQVAAAEVRAPSDGLVVYSTSMQRGRNNWNSTGPLQIGREVSNNELLISLPDVSEMRASVQVHESLAGRLRPGMPATIKIDAVPGHTFEGRVESIGVMAESNNWRDPNLREYTVRVALLPHPASGQLKPSMRAEATVEVGRVDDALTIPVQAIFNDGAVRFAYIVEGNRFTRVPIAVGRRSDTMSEVTVGLAEGQQVLVRQPEPGEVLSREWDPAQLAAAGYQLAENGQIVATSMRGPGGGGEGGGATRGAGRPAGGARERGEGGQSRAKPDATKPESAGSVAQGESADKQAAATRAKAADSSATEQAAKAGDGAEKVAEAGEGGSEGKVAATQAEATTDAAATSESRQAPGKTN
ncbi:MAG: efflux RND transporter periplasmic adaptor subunit [Planctomycetota bacterium]|nr:efflux RND transporter periplasmic adaptor subunit [Planctomycetota bacterium]